MRQGCSLEADIHDNWPMAEVPLLAMLPLSDLHYITIVLVQVPATLASSFPKYTMTCVQVLKVRIIRVRGIFPLQPRSHPVEDAFTISMTQPRNLGST